MRRLGLALQPLAGAQRSVKALGLRLRMLDLVQLLATADVLGQRAGGRGALGIADLTGLMDLLAREAELLGRCLESVLFSDTFRTAGCDLSPLLCGVVFVGEAGFGKWEHLQFASLGGGGRSGVLSLECE
jgi:hypothetical protein